MLGSRIRRLGIPLAVSALLVAGCGGGGGTEATATGSPVPQTQRDERLHAMLPPDVRAKGKLVVGTDASYAPIEFFDKEGKTIVGLDPDLGKALGDKLGIRFEFTNASFDGIIPGMAAGRYDIGMSAFTDNKQRQKTVDFIDYFTAGTVILVAAGNPKNIRSVDDLCGKVVAVERGTVQVTTAETVSKTCVQRGEPPIDVRPFPAETDAQLQVQTGRADADLNDYPVGTYIADQSKGKFEVVGEQFKTAPYGIAVPKGETQLRDALQAALKAIIADGTYDKVLEKWDLQKGAYKEATINGGS